jgi:hypothetical protein
MSYLKPVVLSRWLGRHYRDLAGWLFVLVVYPLLTAAGHATPDSPHFGALAGALLVLMLAGVVGNVLKLRSLDPAIAASRMQDRVSCQPMRFLAGLVALPTLLLWPAGAYFGKAAPNIIGTGYLILAPAMWASISHYGRGTDASPSGRIPGIVGTALLLLFEFTIYSLFLEIFWASGGIPEVSLALLLFMIVPMSLLFFLLLLPATIGFYIEEVLTQRSWKAAQWRLWSGFVLHRYLPAFGLFYLEGHDIELPWVHWLV